MENKISFYYEADAQGTHFQEGIHEDIWELWYRQAASDEGQPHHSSKGQAAEEAERAEEKTAGLRTSGRAAAIVPATLVGWIGVVSWRR